MIKVGSHKMLTFCMQVTQWLIHGFQWMFCFLTSCGFDDSDSDSREEIYGCLSAFALSCGELVEESCILNGVDEAENEEHCQTTRNP